jgi:hypothetical protein
MMGFRVVKIDRAIVQIDIFPTTMGNTSNSTTEHMQKMRNKATVGSMGHFDDAIAMVKLDPTCVPLTCMRGYRVVKIDSAIVQIDIFPTAMGNTSNSTTEHMHKMRNKATVGNKGRLDGESVMEQVEQLLGTKAKEGTPDGARANIQDKEGNAIGDYNIQKDKDRSHMSACASLSPPVVQLSRARTLNYCAHPDPNAPGPRAGHSRLAHTPPPRKRAGRARPKCVFSRARIRNISFLVMTSLHHDGFFERLLALPCCGELEVAVSPRARMSFRTFDAHDRMFKDR